MTNYFNIRKATISDLSDILIIERLCFNEEAFSKRQFSYLISKARGIFYVAESDSFILGYISLLQRANSKGIRIYSIAVHPMSRDLRIGQKLFDAGREFAKREELQYISLEVRTDNTAAINFYRKNGFVETDIIQGYYSDGINAFKMKTFI